MERDKKNVYGGVLLRVIVCGVSLLALGFAIFAMLRTFETGKSDDHRRALQLSEYGLQEAFSKLATARDWGTDFEDEPFEDGGRFGVTFERSERGGVLFLTIVSTGTSGTVVQRTERTLRLRVTAEGDSLWVGGDDVGGSGGSVDVGGGGADVDAGVDTGAGVGDNNTNDAAATGGVNVKGETAERQ